MDMMMKYQRKEDEQIVQGSEGGSTHVHSHHHYPTTFASLPMSNYEVAELTWENGYPAMHGLGIGGILPTAPITKGTPTWCKAGDDNNNNNNSNNNNTLESIVHQATKSHKNNQNSNHIIKLNANNTTAAAASSSGKRDESSAYVEINPSCSFPRKRSAQSGLSNHSVHKNFGKIREECVDLSGCASASATFSHDNDMTIMTWPSFESPPSSKKLITTTTNDDHHPSFCHAKKEKVDEEEWNKNEETVRSHSTRRSRAAAIHNQSERKRRHKINQKMKALQKLVPNASKTDKASMLDEVIEYIKQLQAQLHAQIQMMHVVRNMPHMMMMMQQQQQQQQHRQQQLQMSTMLARMGMGVGMGIGSSNAPPPHFIHPSSTSSTFMPSPFIAPPLIQKEPASLPNPNPFNDPYYAFLAQHMNNIEMFNKMAEMYKTTSESSQPSK